MNKLGGLLLILLASVTFEWLSQTLAPWRSGGRSHLPRSRRCGPRWRSRFGGRKRWWCPATSPDYPRTTRSTPRPHQCHSKWSPGSAGMGKYLILNKFWWHWLRIEWIELLLICTIKNVSGWWFQSLWKIFVNWDDYSQYMNKQNMFQTTNQVCIRHIKHHWTTVSCDFIPW